MMPGRLQARRALLVASLLTMGVLVGPLSVTPASAASADNAIVHLYPYFPAMGPQTLATLKPVTVADGQNYFLFAVGVSAVDADGAWRERAITTADAVLSARFVGDDESAAGSWGGANAFPIAGDANRVLVSVPAASAPSTPSLLKGTALGFTGYFNRLKEEAPREVADPLDDVPTPVDFNRTSAGDFKHSVGLEITPTAGGGYNVTVTALSPVVEQTTLTTPHGTRTVALDSTTPVVESFAGDPVGVVATTAGTRFSLPARVTFGDPVAKFLLCKAATPCTSSVTTALTFEELKANASGSFSPPGEKLTYSWKWGDGATATGVAPTHAYSAPASFTIELTVTDETGRTGTASRAIVILNQPPTGSITVNPDPAHRASPTVLSALATDPDGAVVYYRWFVDGLFKQEGTLSSYTIPIGKIGLGTHEARVNIEDDSGNTANVYKTFEVVNLLPTAAAVVGPQFVQPGVAVRFQDFSTDIDSGGLTRVWDFADGSTGALKDMTHAYASAGVYNPTLTVTDLDGASASLALPAITVDGTAPALTASHDPVPASGWFTSGVRVQASASDDVDASPTITATSNGINLVVSGGEFTVSAQGVNHVVVKATDRAGNVDEYRTTIPIDNAYPTASFSPPAPYATGTERLVVQASDSASGVKRIELFVNNQFHAAVDGQGRLEANWDTTSQMVGRVTVTVKVHDHAGWTTSVSHQVLVLNGPFGMPIPRLP